MHEVEDIQQKLQKILESDPATRHLGIELGEVGRGEVSMTMTVSDSMANGHGICHGGYLFTLADTSLAYCCMTEVDAAVTRTANITFIAPANVGEEILAHATTRVDFGRNMICEVELSVGTRLIAYFTGQGTSVATPQ